MTTRARTVLLSIATGLGLGGAWLSISVYFLSQLRAADALRALADRVRIDLLETRRREKDFLARALVEPDFYRTGTSAHLDLHRDALDRMERDSIDLIRRVPGDWPGDPRSLLSYHREYKEAFAALVDCTRRLGARDLGLEGIWHEGARDLERAVVASNHGLVEREWLLLKADEKDYLLRIDEVSLHAVHRRSDKLRETIRTLAPTAEAMLDRYLRDLAAFHALQQDIGLNETLGLQAKFRAAAHAIEPVAARVVDQADAEYHAATRRLTVGLAVSSGLLCLLLSVTFFLMKASQLRSQQLVETTTELSRSNAELQQFAHVASHDLQEPLRAVAGCVQLLEQRAQGKLDERCAELIRHAVEGCIRMRTLIEDLLTLSRVGTKGKPFVPADCGEVLRAALANLAVPIRETGAVVTQDPLPTVSMDASQMVQVFQNLLGNALKFRADRPPVIHVGALREAAGWRFSVRDNGIGIEPQYFERIFRIFQRLHTRQEYPGSGIGLSVCEKIVLRHGGRIWLESELNKGSTFYFTLPDRDVAV